MPKDSRKKPQRYFEVDVEKTEFEKMQDKAERRVKPSSKASRKYWKKKVRDFGYVAFKAVKPHSISLDLAK